MWVWQKRCAGRHASSECSFAVSCCEADIGTLAQTQMGVINPDALFFCSFGWPADHDREVCLASAGVNTTQGLWFAVALPRHIADPPIVLDFYQIEQDRGWLA